MRSTSHCVKQVFKVIYMYVLVNNNLQQKIYNSYITHWCSANTFDEYGYKFFAMESDAVQYNIHCA